MAAYFLFMQIIFLSNSLESDYEMIRGSFEYTALEK